MSTKTKTNLTVPNGTILFSDGLPRLTYGGFVGSAKVDPRYAMKVKNSNAVVDIRDFFPPTYPPRNLHRRKASTMLRRVRRNEYAHRKAAQANIECLDRIYLNDGEMLAASVTGVEKHLLTSTNRNFADVLIKAKNSIKVRIASRLRQGDGSYVFNTEILSPKDFDLEHFETTPEMNCIEQNDVEVVVHEDAIYKFVGTKHRSKLDAFKKTKNDAVTLRVPLSNDVTADFDRGLTAYYLPDPERIEGEVHRSAIVTLQPANQEFDSNGNPKLGCRVYVLDNIDDLMRKIQDKRNAVPNFDWGSLINTIVPMAGTLIQSFTSSSSSNVRARNGYRLSDLENVYYCKNFAALCKKEGYDSIESMLGAITAHPNANFIGILTNVIGNIVSGITSLFDSTNTTVGEIGPDDVDYRNKFYPLEGEEVTCVSMDASGIGYKESDTQTPVYPKILEEGTQPEGEDTNSVIKIDGEYSVGNSIPRELTWSLDPEFIEGGGNEDNVGVFLQYSEFDFTRIQLNLIDANGFSVPCNSNVVSILNFDSTEIGSSVATFQFIGQGSTVLTASFPYTIVDNKVRTILSDIAVKEIYIGSEIDPKWIVNVVCDDELGSGAEYFNLCTLTPRGFTFEQPNTSEKGEIEIEIHPVNAENNVSSKIRLVVTDVPDGTTPSMARELYELEAGIVDADSKHPGDKIEPKDIRLLYFSTVTGLPIYLGYASDTLVIEEITLNGSTDLTLVEGVNTFVLSSPYDGPVEPPVSWTFSETYVKEVDHVDFTWRTDNFRFVPIREDKLISDADGVSTSDFVCKLVYKNGDEKELASSDFDIEPIRPYIYAADEDIGLAYIMPARITGIDTTILGGSKIGADVIITRESTKPPAKYTFKSIDFDFNDGYTPNVGEYLDINEVKLFATYTKDPQTGTTEEVSVPISSKMAKWWVNGDEANTKFGSARTGPDDTVHVRLGSYTAQRVILCRSTEVTYITATLIGDPNHVPYGTVLTPEMFKVIGHGDGGSEIKEIDAFDITDYYPTSTGEQTVTVSHGELTATVDIVVDEMIITELKIIPETDEFDNAEKVSPSDFEVVATLVDGNTVVVPDYAYTLAEFDNNGAENQTGMLTVQIESDTGSIATASYKFDVGEGGGSVEFNMPVLICEFNKPYCFVGDRLTPQSLGLADAYVIGQDGSRHDVPLEKISLGEYDTSKAGSICVDVEYIDEGD